LKSGRSTGGPVASRRLGPNGEISDEKTREFCSRLLQEFEAWIQRQRR